MVEVLKRWLGFIIVSVFVGWLIHKGWITSKDIKHYIDAAIQTVKTAVSL